MRPGARFGLIAVVAACSSNGGRAVPAPPRPAPSPAAPALREAPVAAPSAAEPRPEAATAPVPAGAIRLADVDPHRAALFVARVFQADVIVAGGTGEPVTLGIQGRTAGEALGELATAAGLSLREEGGRFWLGPAEVLDRQAAAGLRGGRRVDMFFHRADAAAIVRLLADVERISVEGSLAGTVSLAVRDAPSREVLAALVRLAGSRARARGRTVTLTGPGALPATPGFVGEPCNRDTESVMRAVELACVPLAALEVCGTATALGRNVALVRRRDAEPGSGLQAEVRIGSWVGEPATRVTEVDTGGLGLEGGARLVLASSARGDRAP
ncbi:MAG: hypothetical protein HYY06_19745 [Deltaproteobacteria bacterium]|nr:hypothetical protein [Deltaproteobacteria bacterium]